MLLRKTFWITGALAAALYVAPAAAEDKADKMERAHSSADSASGTGSSAADTASDKAHDAKDTASDKAHDAKDATHDAAHDAKASASKTADHLGDKASAMGQQVTSGTARLLAKLHAGNEKEIEHGRAMQEQAKNDKVKDFAKKMVDDHTKMDEDVMAFAQKKSIDLTSAPKPADVTKAHPKTVSDAEYVKMMVSDHQKNVKDVHEAHLKAQKSGDQELASLLEKTHEKMQEHLKDAQKLQKTLTQRQARTPAER